MTTPELFNRDRFTPGTYRWNPFLFRWEYWSPANYGWFRSLDYYGMDVNCTFREHFPVEIVSFEETWAEPLHGF